MQAVGPYYLPAGSVLKPHSMVFFSGWGGGVHWILVVRAKVLLMPGSSSVGGNMGAGIIAEHHGIGVIQRNSEAKGGFGETPSVVASVTCPACINILVVVREEHMGPAAAVHRFHHYGCPGGTSPAQVSRCNVIRRHPYKNREITAQGDAADL